MGTLKNTSQTLFIWLLAASGISVAAVTQAEQIKVPIGQQTAAQEIKMPSKGMNKTKVQAIFGEPLETTPAKGQPPISSWKYAEFIVYFEHEHVIHSVAIFKPQKDQEIILKE
ncbi:hypothetical protein [Cellvibrio fontiphilus]|uniref:Lipoprotein SmpA/OmlA domain-containing protein n=1 Tax=Cellvibrio fontiphilus TaxID=1815559 RepID=A0ABV7FL57_9GAMM